MKDIYSRIKDLSPEQQAAFWAELQKEGVELPGMNALVISDEAATLSSVVRGKEYRATVAQKKMYDLFRANPESTAYNIINAWKINGKPDRNKLGEAFQQLINRHEGLRTSFKMKEQELWQIIHDAYIPPIIYKLARNEDEAHIIIQESIKPFNCEQLPLFEVLVIELDGEGAIVVYNFSHIIVDGVSLHILFRELFLLYSGNELLPPVMQPGDYAALELNPAAETYRKNAASYWLHQFNGQFPVLQLPVDFKNFNRADDQGEEIHFSLNDVLSVRIKSLAVACDCTPFAVLLAAFNILLQRITGQNDIVTGIPFMGRRHKGSENMVGMLVNTVALKTTVNAAAKLTDFVREVAGLLADAQTYQDYPFDELLGQLQVSSNDGRSPLRVLMNSQNRQSRIDTGSLQATPFPVRRNTSTFDLALFPLEESSITFTCTYNTSQFRRETVELIIQGYTALLEQMSEQPTLPLSAYRMLPTTTALHDTKLEPAASWQVAGPFVSIINSFCRIVEKYSDKIAIAYNNCYITYKELQERAYRLSATIKKSIAVSEIPAYPVRAALLLNEGPDTVIGVLGSLLAGCAFLPLDPSFPHDRLVYMLADFQATLLITNEGCKPLAMQLSTENTARLILADEVITDVSSRQSHPISDVSGDEVAFVLYTSGSGGVPKGVMHTQAGFSFFINSCIRELGLNNNDRLALFTSYTHAVGIIDIFSTLLSGGALYLYAVKEKFEQLPAWIAENCISIYHSVPTVFRQLLQITQPVNIYRSVRLIILGGEEVRKTDVALFNLFFDKKCVFVNFLGATELMVVSFHFINHGEVSGPSVVPAGRPVKGVAIQMLEQDGYEAGIFGTGELNYISEFVTVGYCNPADKSNDKLQVVSEIPRLRRFISGDMGRLLPDGTIEYLGRKDRQVKLRGHRIDLTEVEVNMLLHPYIKEAIAELVNHDADETSIQAFYTAAMEIPNEQLVEYLASRLPAYMIPSGFCWLPVLPVTPNNKVDRKALIRLLKENRVVKRPRNSMEQKMLDLFASVLNLQDDHEIGIDDNFFALGGHSLKASLLVSYIKQELAVAINIADIFEAPTVSMLMAKINTRSNISSDSIKPAPRRSLYPLSAAQKRIYFTHEMDGSKISYNLPTALSVQGPFDMQRFEKAVGRLIEMHEALRTSFVKIDNEIWQKIHSDVPFSIMYYTAKDALLGLEHIMRQFVKPFDLHTAPLLRIAVVHFSPTDHWLLTDVHHIIADGTSSEIMINDIAKLYAGEMPDPSIIQYTDYTNWYSGEEQQAVQSLQEGFWLKKLAGALPRLNIVTGKERPAIFTHSGNKYERRIDRHLVQKINNLCLETGCTPFMFHVALLNVLLYKYSGENDIIIGCTSFGRNRPELENIMGLFVNALILRNTVIHNATFRELLLNVKTTCLEAYAHQDYPFDELIQKLQLKRDPSRHPVFDVCIAFQNYKRSTGSINELSFDRMQYHNSSAKFDLLFTFSELENESILSMEYYTGVYTNDFIAHMTSGYFQILEQVITDVNIILPDIKLVTGQVTSEAPFIPKIEFNF